MPAKPLLGAPAAVDIIFCSNCLPAGRMLGFEPDFARIHRMTTDTGKRRLLKALGVGVVGVGIQTGAIPASWVKPVIDSVVMSAHAQVTPSPTPFPTPSPSPLPVPSPVAVDVAPAGFAAVVAGLLGYLGIKRMQRNAAEKRQAPPGE
tara:strand:- start:16094 stop:16537 length:444 start_codon:yes stop_codon:yes gene_type:complete